MMPNTVTSPNKRRTRHDDTVQPIDTPGGRPTSKRRAFLQTMGQQLREYGPQGASPRDHSRGSFGTSPRTQQGPSSTGPVAGSTTRSHIETPESDAAPGEDDVHSGATKSATKWLWRPHEVLSPPEAGGIPQCVFQDLLDWSRSYFDHWHPAFPFLHAPSVLEFFRQVPRTEISTLKSEHALQFTVLRAVLSISLIDARQMSTILKAIPSTLIFHSFNDALCSIQRILTEETSILSLQALISVQLFLISMLRYNAASRLEGLAVRMAFQLRLHHCPIRLGGEAVNEAELRKRLFWSIFCIDRYICIRLGIPLGISSDDIDVCFPHSEQHGNRSTNEDRDDRLDLLDFLARHADIRGSIMEVRNRHEFVKKSNESEAIMAIEAEHTKWWNYVDEYLSNCDQTLSITKPHQVTLVVLRFETVIALHRSVLATSNKNAAYNAALQRCISASRSVINTLHKALQGFGAFDGSPGQSGYQSTPLLWPSFTWGVWMSTFIVVFAATEKQVPRDVALRLAKRSIEILKHLALRGTNWPESCIVAIENLISRLEDRSREPSRNPMSEPSRSHIAADPAGLASGSGAQKAHYPNVPSMMPAPIPLPMFRQPSLSQMATIPSSAANALNTSTFSESSYLSTTTNLASSYLAGSGTFLGIAQQLSDNPIPNHDIMSLFNSENMGLWTGEEFGFGSGI